MKETGLFSVFSRAGGQAFELTSLRCDIKRLKSQPNFVGKPSGARGSISDHS